jgi:hypothetical protein
MPGLSKLKPLVFSTHWEAALKKKNSMMPVGISALQWPDIRSTSIWIRTGPVKLTLVSLKPIYNLMKWLINYICLDLFVYSEFGYNIGFY